MKKRQKTAFGEYLVSEIKLVHMSQEEFYKSVGIKKPYFYDILTAAPPPLDLQNRMLEVLEEKTDIDPYRRSKFYDLAAQGRSEIPVDIGELIKSNPEKWDNVRTVLNQLLAVQR